MSSCIPLWIVPTHPIGRVNIIPNHAHERCRFPAGFSSTSFLDRHSAVTFPDQTCSMQECLRSVTAHEPKGNVHLTCTRDDRRGRDCERQFRTERDASTGSADTLSETRITKQHLSLTPVLLFLHPVIEKRMCDFRKYGKEEDDRLRWINKSSVYA